MNASKNQLKLLFENNSSINTNNNTSNNNYVNIDNFPNINVVSNQLIKNSVLRAYQTNNPFNDNDNSQNNNNNNNTLYCNNKFKNQIFKKIQNEEGNFYIILICIQIINLKKKIIQ